MIDLRFSPLPLSAWPVPPTRDRERSQFSAPYAKTLDLLEKELYYLGALDITIQAGFKPAEIRNDGWPRAGAKPEHPGVVLSYISRKQRYQIPCDRFLTFAENLRAVALALEALRKIERYGITRTGQQYAGWAKAIGPAPTFAAPPDSVLDAARFIAAQSGLGFTAEVVALMTEDGSTLGDYYRAAAVKTHPDQGGDAESFIRLQEAIETVRTHQAASR